jgi:hypothetical protein
MKSVSSPKTFSAGSKRTPDPHWAGKERPAIVASVINKIRSTGRSKGRPPRSGALRSKHEPILSSREVHIQTGELKQHEVIAKASGDQDVHTCIRPREICVRNARRYQDAPLPRGDCLSDFVIGADNHDVTGHPDFDSGYSYRAAERVFEKSLRFAFIRVVNAVEAAFMAEQIRPPRTVPTNIPMQSCFVEHRRCAHGGTLCAGSAGSCSREDE